MDSTQTVVIATPSTPTAPPSRKMGLAQVVLMGSGFAGGGTIVLGAIELVRSEPDKAFKLLHDWGPWCFLAMFVAYVINKIANRALDVGEKLGIRVADALDSVATQQKSQAEAMQSQAVALQKSADKDDRQLQEMQTLTSLTAQRSEKTYAMLQQYHEDNRMILQQQQASLDRIEAKVDGKTTAVEKS